MPSANGLSGPTTVSSIFFSWAKARSFGKSSAPILTHSTGFPVLRTVSCRIPALPGAHQSSVTCGDWASFHTNACSRPPEPITTILIKAPAGYVSHRVEATGREPAGFARMSSASLWINIRRNSGPRGPRPSDLNRHRHGLGRHKIQRWILDGAQVHFATFPGLYANVIQHSEAIPKGKGIKRVVCGPE